MRQIMPHRSNIGVRRPKCKIFLSEPIQMARSATFFPHRPKPRTAGGFKFLMLNNGLYVLQMFTGLVPIASAHS